MIKVRKNPHGYYWKTSRYSRPSKVRAALHAAKVVAVQSAGVARIAALMAHGGIGANVAICETLLEMNKCISSNA